MDATASASVFEFATLPDLLRLLAIPFFGAVAWRDIKTRRVPNRTWYPLAALAVFLLVWESYTVMTADIHPVLRQQFFIQVGISVLFLIPLSYLFWRIGGFGGADFKAFAVIAVLFPTFPAYEVHQLGVDGVFAALPGIEQAATLPAVETAIGVFSITILTNTVLVGLLYPVALAGKNTIRGYLSPGMFIARPIRWDESTEEYGTVLEFPDHRLRDVRSVGELRAYFNWRQLDLDALRMYLRWRGVSLEELREDPASYRDPTSLPDEPNPPTDGAIVTDGGTPADGELIADGGTEPARKECDDPWGAEAFLEDIEYSAYGTTPEELRAGLDSLTSDDVVWISPGIPFIVPLFVGLLVSFTYGDVLFALLDALNMTA